MFSYVNIEFRYGQKINTSEFAEYVLYNIQILDLVATSSTTISRPGSLK